MIQNARLQAVAACSLISGFLAFGGSAAFAKSVTFQVDDAKGRDVVQFTSDAPIELIVGHTNKITGSVTVDDSLNLSKKPLQAEFDVDLASIDTGIPLRNEHMRDNFLETSKYPKASFKLKTLAGGPTLKPGQKTKLIATGDFTLHGKTVQKKVPVFVTYLKRCKMTEEKTPGCDLLQISTEFNVPFADHDIKRPEIVFQKLADTVIVKVSTTAWFKVSDSTEKSDKDVETKPGTKKS
jgi:polyisoprenoid-binding protein YceI